MRARFAVVFLLLLGQVIPVRNASTVVPLQAPVTALPGSNSCSAATTAVEQAKTKLDDLLDLEHQLSEAEANLDALARRMQKNQDLITDYKSLEDAAEQEKEQLRQMIESAVDKIVDIPKEVIKEFKSDVGDGLIKGSVAFVLSGIATRMEVLVVDIKGLIIQPGSITVLVGRFAVVERDLYELYELGVSGSELVEGLNRLALRIKLATFLGGLGGLSGSVLVLDAKLAYDNHELSAELQSYLDAQNDLELLRPQLDQAKAEVSALRASAKDLESRIAAAQMAYQDAMDARAKACAEDNAVTWGDPHLVTFDGVAYDFQQVGEFILAKSDISDFQIQVRQSPWGGTSQTVAENSAVAFDVGGHRVGIYTSSGGVETLVDGATVTLSETPFHLPGGGNLVNDPGADDETVAWPDGAFATVDYSGGSYFSLSINVPHSERGHLSGLLGNDNGRAADEFRTSTGITLANPPAGKELYGEYSNSWRVTPADSLFTYGPDQSTSTFTNLAFPYSPVDVASLSEPDRKAGISICRSEGVRAEPFLDACVLDVAETGDGVVAAGAAAAESFETSGTGTKAARNLIANPCLQVGGLVAGHESLRPGATILAGWQIGGGGVDIAAPTGSSSVDDGWEPASGCPESSDLSGGARGSLSQSVPTAAGKKYILSWEMAGIPTSGAEVKAMRVFWNGKLVASPRFDVGRQSLSSMGWSLRQVIVVARSTSSVVKFSDASAPVPHGGATLDAVSLSPETSTNLPAAAISAVPTASSPPAIVDDEGHAAPAAGDVLLADPGQWAGSPTAYSYQWRDCSHGSCGAIAGARSATYQVVPTDVGSNIDVLVSARNEIGTSAPVISRLTDPVRPGTAPDITSVSGLYPEATDHVVIRGTGFGALAPFNGNSPYIQLADVTKGWNAGNSGTLPTGRCAVSSDGDDVTINVTSWTNTKIDINGFTGPYGGGWTYSPGDKVEVEVWNPRSSAGPACHTATVLNATAAATQDSRRPSGLIRPH